MDLSFGEVYDSIVFVGAPGLVLGSLVSTPDNISCNVNYWDQFGSGMGYLASLSYSATVTPHNVVETSSGDRLFLVGSLSDAKKTLCTNCSGLNVQDSIEMHAITPDFDGAYAFEFGDVELIRGYTAVQGDFSNVTWESENQAFREWDTDNKRDDLLEFSDEFAAKVGEFLMEDALGFYDNWSSVEEAKQECLDNMNLDNHLRSFTPWQNIWLTVSISDAKLIGYKSGTVSAIELVGASIEDRIVVGLMDMNGRKISSRPVRRTPYIEVYSDGSAKVVADE
jgi:hypothetical protein